MRKTAPVYRSLSERVAVELSNGMVTFIFREIGSVGPIYKLTEDERVELERVLAEIPDIPEIPDDDQQDEDEQ